MAQHQTAPKLQVDPSVFDAATPIRKAEPVPAPQPHPLSNVTGEKTAVVSPANAQAGAAASGMGELAKPAVTAPQQGTTQPATDDAQHRQQVTEGMELLKESKHVLRPGDKGPEVALLQQQLKQLGLHIKETGVMDKSTQAIIKAIQTGGGLGPDGAVGPKTIDQLLTLDKSSLKSEGQTGADDKVDHMPDDPKLAAVYLFNRMRAKNASENLTPQQEQDMEQFLKNWDANKARYEKVSQTAGIPPKLIAALHWRESTGDFGTYLHQGDPLGKKAVHEPADIPIFKTWEPAAQHALGQKADTQREFKIDANTTDEAALASYAERYNGLGYHNYHAQASPYVFAGTDQYKKGKYVGDGDWDGNYKDSQLGVVAMMRRLDRHDREAAEKAARDKANGQQQQQPNQHFAQ